MLFKHPRSVEDPVKESEVDVFGWQRIVEGGELGSRFKRKYLTAFTVLSLEGSSSNLGERTRETWVQEEKRTRC